MQRTDLPTKPPVTSCHLRPQLPPVQQQQPKAAITPRWIIPTSAVGPRTLQMFVCPGTDLSVQVNLSHRPVLLARSLPASSPMACSTLTPPLRSTHHPQRTREPLSPLPSPTSPSRATKSPPGKKTAQIRSCATVVYGAQRRPLLAMQENC